MPNSHVGPIEPPVTLEDIFEEVDGIKDRFNSTQEQLIDLTKKIDDLLLAVAALSRRLDQ
jgi:hypothetical protein